LFSILDIFMRGRLSWRGGEKYLLPPPPGEYILRLAEIESPGGGNISAGGRLYKGGDFISGHRL